MDIDLTLRAKEFASKDPFPMKGFGPVEWWVGNAFMTAQGFRSLLGMEIVGYCGPETGVRDRSSYLMRSDQIQFIISGAQGPDHEISDHVKLHGPGVRMSGSSSRTPLQLSNAPLTEVPSRTWILSCSRTTVVGWRRRRSRHTARPFTH